MYNLVSETRKGWSNFFFNVVKYLLEDQLLNSKLTLNSYEERQVAEKQILIWKLKKSMHIYVYEEQTSVISMLQNEVYWF